MSQRHEMRGRLRARTPELVARTLRGDLNWGDALFTPGRKLEITGLGAAVMEHYRRVPSVEAWVGLPLLANWAPTPFEIDRLHCASVESFYHSLKFPESSS